METELSKIIKERGLKQGFIASKAGMTPSAISLIVRGKSMPTLLAAIKIARAVNKTVEELWGHLVEEENERNHHD